MEKDFDVKLRAVGLVSTYSNEGVEHDVAIKCAIKTCIIIREISMDRRFWSSVEEHLYEMLKDYQNSLV